MSSYICCLTFIANLGVGHNYNKPNFMNYVTHIQFYYNFKVLQRSKVLYLFLSSSVTYNVTTILLIIYQKYAPPIVYFQLLFKVDHYC